MLVGVTRWCAQVAPVNDLPKLGDCWHMESVDEILELKPTLVIGSVPYKHETVAKLLDQPFAFLAMNPRSLADVYADIRMLGGIVGRLKPAEALVCKLQREFAAIELQTKERDKSEARLRVYCEAWPNPRISSPPWVAELVGLCGAEMVVPAGERVDENQVAAAKPDVIVLAWAAAGDRANPDKAYEVQDWREVPAIRNRHVFVIKDELLNTPGPPLVLGARELQKILGHRARNKRQRRDAERAEIRGEMRTVVAAVIEQSDRRLLIGQRRRNDTSPFKWEFPGGKVEQGETPVDALARELKEELGATLQKSIPIGRVLHNYAETPDQLEILFFAAAISDGELTPRTFEKIAWVLPKELGDYDFLAANAGLVANLATGKIKPRELLETEE